MIVTVRFLVHKSWLMLVITVPSHVNNSIISVPRIKECFLNDKTLLKRHN